MLCCVYMLEYIWDHFSSSLRRLYTGVLAQSCSYLSQQIWPMLCLHCNGEISGGNELLFSYSYVIFFPSHQSKVHVWEKEPWLGYYPSDIWMPECLWELLAVQHSLGHPWVYSKLHQGLSHWRAGLRILLPAFFRHSWESGPHIVSLIYITNNTIHLQCSEVGKLY